jgi:phytoene dehydrogenase-like protein
VEPALRPRAAGKLVQGLAAAVARSAVTICEGTTVTEISPARR